MWTTTSQHGTNDNTSEVMDTVSSTSVSQKSSTSMLFCCMCQSIYTDPKILPCLHSFCRHCLESAAAKQDTSGVILICAICKHKIQLPSGGVDDVPDNCFLSRMCQEYLLQVQGHLVARSLHSAATGSLTEFSPPTHRGSSELSHSKYSPLSGSPLPVQDSTKATEEESLIQDVSLDSNSVPGQSTAVEAIRNMSRLQTKVMNLQGEALRVTYAIDQVNQCTIDWYEHKEEMKKAVERRSSQFQFFIKRMEHQLMNQIDSKQTDDVCYAESNKVKTELRKNLNNILHDVNVLKNIQDYGRDAEINALSTSLLGKSVGLTDVVLKKLHFDIETPSKTIEEIVNEYFGNVKIGTEECTVFAPEVKDFSDISVGSTTEQVAGADDVQIFTSREEMSFEDNKEPADAAIKSSKKRAADRKSRRYNTDLGMDKEDVKDFLAQFQNARENFRSRRKEILERGQMVRQDSSPLRSEIERRTRSPSVEGRFQSLDRVLLPKTARGRPVDRRRSYTQEIFFAAPTDNKSSHLEDGVDLSQPEPTTELNYGAQSSHYAPRLVPPSPVTEEATSPTSPQRKLVKQISDPDFVQSPKEEVPNPGGPPSDHSQSLLERLRSRRLSSPSSSLLMIRRHSEQNIPPFPGETYVSEGLPHDKDTTRPVRRAISSASDRKAKIEFLRENWQKRKEILIQNEGFVSPDSANKHATRPSTQVQSPPQILSPVQPNSLGKFAVPEVMATNEIVSPISPTPSDPRMESLQQIRNRVAQYRNELNRKSETRQQEMNSNTPSYQNTTVSKQPSSSIPEQVNDPASPSQTSPRTAASSTLPYSTFYKHSSVITLDVSTAHQEEHTITSPTQTNTPVPSPRSTGSQSSTYKYAPETTTTSNQQVPPIKSPSDETKIPLQSPRSTTTNFMSQSPSFKYTNDIPATSIQEEHSTTSSPTQDKTSLASPRTPAEPTVYQTSIFSYTPTTTAAAAASAIAQKEPATTISLTQPKALPTAPHTSISSRVSRLTRSTETVDVASLISAMYLGKEKSIIHDSPPVSVTSSAQVQVTSAPTTAIATISGSRLSENSLFSTSALTSTSVSATSPPKSEKENTYDTETKQLNRLNGHAKIDSKDGPRESFISTEKPSDSQEQSSLNKENLQEPIPQSQRKQTRHGMRSRFTEGVNRRHTIEIGKNDIQTALQMISKEETTPKPQTPLQPISESATKSRAPVHIPYRSRLTDSSKMLESAQEILPPDEVTENDEIEDVTIAFKIKASGVTTKIIPSPLEVIQEKSVTDQNFTPEPVTVMAGKSGTSPLPSPTSPNAHDTAQKVKLREIARKKKERWRHLTIH